MEAKRTSSYPKLRVHLKTVVEALMEGKKTYSQLLKLTKENKKEIPEKMLTRILDILEFTGLAIKTKDGWAWYTYKKKYNPGMSKHATQLAPGFAAVSPFYVPTGYTVDDKYIPKEKVSKLKKYALAHIETGYPTINNVLTEFKNLKSKLAKTQTHEAVKFVNNLEKEGKTKKLFFTATWKKEPARSWFRKLFPKTRLHIESKNTYLLGPFETEKELREVMEKHDLTVKGLHRAENNTWFIEGPVYMGKVEVADFLKTREAFMQVSENLVGEISKLLLKIEWGYYHLDGECELCSEIAFADTA